MNIATNVSCFKLTGMLSTLVQTWQLPVPDPPPPETDTCTYTPALNDGSASQFPN